MNKTGGRRKKFITRALPHVELSADQHLFKTLFWGEILWPLATNILLNVFRRIFLNYLLVILARSRIHERAISLRFQGKILRELRLEVSAYNVYITNQFQTNFAQGREGG
jgi:hypothetical protein